MSNAKYSENVDHEFVPNNTETIHLLYLIINWAYKW